MRPAASIPSPGELLIQGVQLGKVFVGVQPTFGYEGDPMRLMMARSGARIMASWPSTPTSRRCWKQMRWSTWARTGAGVYAGQTSWTLR